MTRRPLCLLFLLLMLAALAMDRLGIPLIRGNPLPEEIRAYVQEHPDTRVCGTVRLVSETEFTQILSLQNSYLIVRSETYPIENTIIYRKKGSQIMPGAFLCVSGNLEEFSPARNPGGFDARSYYNCRHFWYMIRNARILSCRDPGPGLLRLAGRVKEYLRLGLASSTGEDAGTFEALVLGDRTELSDEVRLRYQMAGILHILSISGLHISLIGIGLFRLLKKAGLGNLPATVPAFAAVLLYGTLSGGGVSTVRAVIMFLASVMAAVTGRIYDPLSALSLAGMLLLFDSPGYLTDGSFLLSFGAVAGIGTAAPVLRNAFLPLPAGRKRPLCLTCLKKTGRVLLSSAAVQLAILPVVLYTYGEVPAAGILLNLLILPTAGAVLVSGLLAGLLGGAAFLPAWEAGTAAGVAVTGGRLAAWPGRLLLLLYERLASFCSRIGLKTWIIGSPAFWQSAVYVILLALSLWILDKAVRLRRKKRRRRRNAAEEKRVRRNVLLLKSAGLLLLSAAITVLCVRTEGPLAVTFLDVGQGDGAVISLGSSCFVIDCGSSDEEQTGQYTLIPFLRQQGIGQIKGIFVSHTDEDHINGIRELLLEIREDLVSIQADCLFLPDWSEEPEAYRELVSLAADCGIRVIRVRQTQAFEADGLRFTVLAPAGGAAGRDPNEDGMVLDVAYGESRFLFTGDIGEETERKLLPYVPDVDVLKTAHHGSRFSSSTEFLEAARPELAVISCGKDNSYGHPAPETVERLQNAGCRIEYTMNSGAVTVLTDGENIWIRRFLES
ncbi:MAG: DNA internalization-related competence protein ComEC/Rec2 [Blautia sp.]|nr:DNA internalization-related competence protein ComEC/Rec2 [Blautia sp.]